MPDPAAATEPAPAEAADEAKNDAGQSRHTPLRTIISPIAMHRRPHQVHLRGVGECLPPICALDAPRSRVQVTLADQQADPNSPLFSAKTFEELGL